MTEDEKIITLKYMQQRQKQTQDWGSDWWGFTFLFYAQDDQKELTIGTASLLPRAGQSCLPGFTDHKIENLCFAFVTVPSSHPLQTWESSIADPIPVPSFLFHPNQVLQLPCLYLVQYLVHCPRDGERCKAYTVFA